jgi:hypothetical protein
MKADKISVATKDGLAKTAWSRDGHITSRATALPKSRNAPMTMAGADCPTPARMTINVAVSDDL